MKLGLFILKFLFIGALFIISNANLHLNSSVERDQFFDLFYSWLSDIFTHASQIVGYVVDSKWLPENNARLGIKQFNSKA